MRVGIGDDGHELEVSVTGSGPPLYFIAGLGDGLDSWAPVAAEWHRDHTCVTFDNRGCGASDTPPGPYTITDFADDAHRLFSQLELGAGPVVGSSMGGTVAQTLTLTHPAQVAALALCNTVARSNAMTRAILAHWIALACSGQLARLAESTSVFSFSETYLADNFDTETAEYPAIENVAGFVAAAHGCRQFDVTSDLHLIKVPTLVVAGTYDILTTVEKSAELAGLIPDSTLVQITSGHMICVEKPTELAGHIAQFLDRRAIKGAER